MIVDARSLPTSHRFNTDICVVGGGTAGLVLAQELAGQAFRVLVLESGGREPEPETQALAEGANLGFPYFPLATARERVLGGSGTRWNIPIGANRLGVRLRPLDALDLETKDWVERSGWPFDRAYLEPYYRRAQAICQVEPASFAVRNWSDPVMRPELNLRSPDVQTIIYKFAQREVLARDLPARVCEAENVTVCLHGTVLEVQTKLGRSEVTGLRVGVLGGPEFGVKARCYVLALGGIETPRLLLLSNRVQKAGLGNDHDLVGRCFMEHPHFWSGMLVPQSKQVFARTSLYNEIHSTNGVAVVGKFALKEETLRRERLLNQNVQLFVCHVLDPFKYRGPRSPAVEACRALLSGDQSRQRVGERLRTILSGLDDVALAGARKMRHLLVGVPRIPVFIFANMMEQVPNPESRVTLGSQRDAFGQPRVQLDWRMTSQDMRSAMRTQEIIGTALEEAGLGRFYRELKEEVPPGNTEGGYHHMGTTRMHVDPKQGVVDANCKLHGLDNLYVAGPSVFPTGGYANPVLTIVALTTRLADHLKRRVLSSAAPLPERADNQSELRPIITMASAG